MVEWLGIGIGVVLFILFVGGIIVSWNIAKGGVDIMEFFGGRRGTVRGSANYITGESSKKQQDKKPKWSKSGKLK